MKREFLSQGLIYTLPTMFSKGMALLLLPLYTRVLSPGQYGTFDLLILSASVLNIVIGMEISQAVARFSVPEKDKCKSNNFAITGMSFGIFCYFIFAIMFLSLGNIIRPLLSPELSAGPLYNLAIVFISLSGLFNIISNQLRWKFRTSEYSFTLIIQILMTALLSLILLYLFDLGLVALLGGLVAGMAAGIIVSLFFLRNDLSFGISRSLLKQMLKYSIPLIPSGLCVWMATGIDRIMVISFFSVEELGVYSLAFKLSSVISILLVGLQTSLAPLILRDFENKQLKDELSDLFTIFVYAAGAFVIGLVLFAELILWKIV